MSVRKRHVITGLGEDAEKSEPSSTAGGNPHAAVPLRNRSLFPHLHNYHTTQQVCSEIYNHQNQKQLLKKKKTIIHEYVQYYHSISQKVETTQTSINR